MTPQEVKRTIKSLRPGDGIELVWRDANTTARWVEASEAAGLSLSPILTRGTFISVDSEGLRVALDSAVKVGTKTLEDFHGIGVVDPPCITEIYKTQRARPRAAKPRVKK